MSRREIFDAIKATRGKGFTSAEVAQIDAVLTSLGIPVDQDDAAVPIALKLIKQAEGCELKAYPDPGTGGDPWTIGWGATGSGIAKGITWTQAQADARLEADVRRFAEGVDAALGGALTTPGQRGALISFAYNVGLKALRDSTLLRMHKAGDHEGAALQFGRWNKAAGKVLNGLTKRRAAEAAVYRGQA